MGPISAISRNQNRFDYGFTLIELILVLTLLGLMAGIVMPRVTTVFDRFGESTKRDDALSQIGNLGLKVKKIGKPWVLQTPGASKSLDMDDQEEEELLALPDGWTLKVDKPIYFYENGYCTGGSLQLKSPTRSYPINLEPPYCAPRK